MLYECLVCFGCVDGVFVFLCTEIPAVKFESFVEKLIYMQAVRTISSKICLLILIFVRVLGVLYIRCVRFQCVLCSVNPKYICMTTL